MEGKSGVPGFLFRLNLNPQSEIRNPKFPNAFF